MKNRIVCYTCITGGYDVLKDPAIVPDNIDFICFSDVYIQSSIWKCVPIPEELKYLSTVKQQRIVKICPHRYLSDYDISIWVDGNIAIIGNLNNFILQYDLNICSLYIRKHPSRNNVYDEAKTIITLNKESLDIVQNIINRYSAEHYPKNNGLVESNIILRKHIDTKCQNFNYAWAQELLLNSHRDQLSFNYIVWKINFNYKHLTNEENLRHNNIFTITSHE